MSNGTEKSEMRPYSDAVAGYLAGATWLGALDGPLVVHAKSIALSLDKQLEERGEIQSALASSFDKVLMRLDQRRPEDGPTPTDPRAPGPAGTASIFTVLDDTA